MRKSMQTVHGRFARDARASGGLAVRTIRILIADDHYVVRSGLRALLSEQTELASRCRSGGRQGRLFAQVLKDRARCRYRRLFAARPQRRGGDKADPAAQPGHGGDHFHHARQQQASSTTFCRRARSVISLKSDAKRLLLTAVEMVAEHKPFFTGMVSETLLECFPLQGQQTSR